MRIVFVCETESAGGLYRSIGPMAALARAGHDVRRVGASGERPSVELLRQAEIVHLYRDCGPDALALVQSAKAAGAAVVWDNDDDMGALPRNNPSYRRYGGIHWERRLAAMRRIFRIADLITAPSPTLAARLAGVGAARTQVIENQIADEFLFPGAPPRPGVTIGWIAGLEHRADLDALPVQAALQRLVDERDDVHVVSIGLGLGLRGAYQHIDKVRFSDLVRHAATFDVGIAPLSDIDFNRARSNVKLKEYAAAGVPWLASPVGPYAELGEKQGGRLVDDDDWHAALSRIVDKERERRKLAKRACRWARTQTIDGNLGAWMSAFEVAITAAR